MNSENSSPAYHLGWAVFSLVTLSMCVVYREWFWVAVNAGLAAYNGYKFWELR